MDFHPKGCLGAEVIALYTGASKGTPGDAKFVTESSEGDKGNRRS